MEKNSTFLHQDDCGRQWSKIIFTRGIFHGDNPFEKIIPFALFRLCMFHIISKLLHHFLKHLRQAEYVRNLLTGIILGPSIIGVYKDYARMKDLPIHKHFQEVAACLGVVYYVFIISVKCDNDNISRTGRKVWAVGMSSLLAPFVVMVFLNFILHPITFKDPAHVFVFSMQLSASSVTTLAPILEELSLLTTVLGRLSLSSSMTNELIICSCWVVLTLLETIFVRHSFIEVFGLVIIIASTICILEPAMNWIIERVPGGGRVNEFYVVFMLLGGGIMAALFGLVLKAPILGAAFFGLIVPHGPPLGSEIVEKGETFNKNCFLPFFYLSIGDMINVYEMKNWRSHLIYQLIIVAGYLTKTLATMLAALGYNMSLRQAFILGLEMTTSGLTQNIIFWALWFKQKVETSVVSQLVLSSMVVTSLVTPLLFHLHKKQRNICDPVRGFELSIQAASTGPKMQIIACMDDKDDIPAIITILEASNPTKSRPLNVYVIHLTDLDGRATPLLVPHKKHKRMCNYNGCVPIANALHNCCDDSNSTFSIQLLTLIAPLRTMHEEICRLAQDKMIPLIIIPLHYKSLDHHTQHAISSDVNRNIQVQTPCTVGIFINRELATNERDQGYFPYQVAVLFFGGEDDREALAYACRMSEHPRITVTCLRIFVEDFYDTNEEERLLDENLIDSFRVNIMYNECGFIQEIRVKDWLKAIQIVQAIDYRYDLVMVGRRHGETAQQEKEMSTLNENPELGHIGAMLASTEFHQAMFSILVMQHHMENSKGARS